MRNLKLFILLNLVNVSAFGQRYVDLNVKFASPNYGDSIISGSMIYVQISVTNQGPDTLQFDDTLVYKLSHNFNTTDSEVRRLPLNRMLSKDESTYFYDSILVEVPKQIKQTNIFFETLPVFVSTNGITMPDYLLPESYNDKMKDNNPNLKLFIRQDLVSIQEKYFRDKIILYPNPVFQNESEIKVDGLTSEIVSSFMVSLDGKVHCMEAERGETFYYFRVPEVQPGIYFIKINTLSTTYINKLLIL